jgi:plastocyanin
MKQPRTALFAGLLSMLFAAAAMAAPLQVSVTGADGKPAPDVVVLLTPSAAWPAQPLPEPAVIAQKDIRFLPYVTVVPVGATVRFVNKDSFDHHVRSQPGGPLGTIAPAKQFEFRMPAVANGKESMAELKLDVPGSIVLGCHLHGSMRGHVFVASTPWAAVTDANGKAAFAEVPEGQADLRLWHPDQLAEQPAARVQLGAQVTKTDAKLNFTPKPPRRPAKGEYDY